MIVTVTHFFGVADCCCIINNWLMMQLRTVVADGNRGFLKIYGSVWAMIVENHAQGYTRYVMRG